MYTQSALGSNTFWPIFWSRAVDHARRQFNPGKLFTFNYIAVKNRRVPRPPDGVRGRLFPSLHAHSDQLSFKLTDRGLAPWRSVGIAKERAPLPIHLTKKAARLGTTFGPGIQLVEAKHGQRQNTQKWNCKDKYVPCRQYRSAAHACSPIASLANERFLIALNCVIGVDWASLELGSNAASRW